MERIAILGVGLLGGSLGQALRQRRLVQTVVGYVRRPESIAEVLAAGAADQATTDVAEAVRRAELVVLCTPLGQMAALISRALPALESGAIVTDVGSVKASVVAELEPLVAQSGARFVGSHPMAGGERMGVASARPDLYQGALCVVTPTAQSDPDAVAGVTALWAALGARTLCLSPAEHDDLASRSSHLVQLVASQLANYVLDPTQPPNQPDLCATGFRDTTRIASGSPEMWRDIALANRDALLHALTDYTAGLQQLQQILAAADADALHTLFAQAKRRRDAWIERYFPTPTPPA
jgi:prephenate dehydrogenase